MAVSTVDTPGTSDPASKLDAKRLRVAPFDMELGPLRHMAAARRWLSLPRFDNIGVIPRGATPGAEITGVDLRDDMTDEVINDIRRPHTVGFWDKRAVQHYASSDYWPDVRIMERASIVGPRPE